MLQDTPPQEQDTPPEENVTPDEAGSEVDAEEDGTNQAAGTPEGLEEAPGAGSPASDTPEEAAPEAGLPEEGSLESLLTPDKTEGSAIETLFGVDLMLERGRNILVWARENLLTLEVALQFGVLVAALVPAAIFGPQLKKFITGNIAPRAPYGVLRRAANAFANIATAIALYLVLQISVFALGAAGFSSVLVQAGISLLGAWIVIRLVSLVIRSPFWSKVAFYLAWPIAALDAFGLLDNVVQQLEALSVPLGQNSEGETVDFSALDFIRTIITFGILFWLANTVNRFLQSRLAKVEELTPSLQAMVAKILDVLMPVVAFLLALQIVGFNLATLTIFGGAIGLGVGLGLQRTVSNFFAGFTLVADKSIKPGDVIEVGDTFGWVTQMNARYVSVRTRDGTAHLIPNDKFIEDGVINWSFLDKVVRVHAGFGVAYSTRDLRAVKAAAEQAALRVERVLEKPAPMCNLVEMGDSSVNFDLRFWINDPANGLSNVRSLVFLELWDTLHEMGVEIPFPQRDLHIKSAPPGLMAGLGAPDEAAASRETAENPATAGPQPNSGPEDNR